MRRFGIGGLDAVEFDAFQRPGLSLQLLLQLFAEFALFDEHGIHLLDLMFQVRDVRFELLNTLAGFVTHKIRVSVAECDKTGHRRHPRGSGP